MRASPGTLVSTVGSKKKPSLPMRLPPVSIFAPRCVASATKPFHGVDATLADERAHLRVRIDAQARPLDRAHGLDELRQRKLVIDAVLHQKATSARRRPGRRCGTCWRREC